MKIPPIHFVVWLLLMGNSSSPAQLTWDANTVTADVQNGGGTWNLLNTNWHNGNINTTWDNSGSIIAAFGTSASKTGGTITVEGTVKVGGLTFNAFSSSTMADLPVTSAYTIAGGTLQFADNAIIEAANNTSSGSSGVLFINLNSTLVGNGLTIQRKQETVINAFQYVRFSTANPNLTGVLDINSRSTGQGIFMLLSGSNTVSSMERIVVQSGSVLAAGGASNTYNIPMTLGGTGQGNGAIRVDSSNMRFAGPITLTDDTTVLTNRNIVNTVIDAAIGDGGGGFGFQRFASSSNSVLTLSGTSTYGGITTIGRISSAAAGITLLNFAADSAPKSDMLYHDLTNAGGLTLIGGSQGTATFNLLGKNFVDNSQRFGAVSISGSRSNLILAPGIGGRMEVSLGTITRTSPASLTITSEVPGAITTTTADGFLGPWSALVNKTGHGAWVNVLEGKLTEFVGDNVYATGAELKTLGIAADVTINGSSTGNVLGGTGTYQVNTLSMTDGTASRVIDIGTDNVLRLGSTGGIQLTKDALNLDIGISGSAGALRAGTGTAQMWLTNLSKTGILTINSVIENNGASALSLYFNGTSKTVLAGANTFTGTAQIGSGEVEIRHSTALGTTAGATTVLYNGTLRLGGGISTAEPITLNGLGANGIGALVNSDGVNEITRAVVIGQPSRINSEAGNLVFKAADGGTDAINASGSGATTFFGGAGDITVQGRLNAAANVITKDGSGTLTFAGTQIFTAAMALTSGTVHLDFSNTASPVTNILYNGIATPVALTLNSTNLRLTGATGAANSQTFGALTVTNLVNINLNPNGAASLNLTFGTVARSFGGILALDLPSGSSLRVNSGADNTLITANNRAYAYIRDSVNGDEWAATGVASGGTRPVVKLSSFGGYTDSTATTLAGNANVITETTTLAADTTVSTLRFAQPQAALITDGAAVTTLTTGGILVSSTVGEQDITISTDILRAAPATIASNNPELTIIQNNTQGALNITSNISNSLTNTGAAGTVSVIKAGPGLVVLSGANAFTGNLRVYEGAVQFAGGSTVSSSIEFLLGSGASSGKVILGQGSTGYTPSIDYIQSVGTGTENRIVGGSSAVSQLLITGSASTPSDFRTGILGGPGLYENNLEFRLASLGSLVTLGANNTYAGATVNSRGIMVVEKLANIGEVSSLGTGDRNTAAATIVMANQTTGAVGSYATAVIRYVGNTDSVTNRPINVSNTDDIRDIVTVTAVLENIGTGTVKFTAPFTASGGNIADRLLQLTGTNAGLNEIVSFANASTTILGRLEKDGPGTWALTGNSTYSGGTTVLQGILLANNPLTGSATGLGTVQVNAAAILGGTGRIAPAEGNSILISGGTLNPGLPGITHEAGKLTLSTLGAGMLTLETDAVIHLDLVSGAGQGNNTLNAASADQLVISGKVTLGTGITLRVANPNNLSSWAANDQWQLFDWAGLDGTVAGSITTYDLPSLPEGLFWDTSDLFGSGILSISLVPEPGRLGLLGFALIGLLVRRRR